VLIGGGRANPIYAAFWHTALVRYVDFMDNFLAPTETCHTADNFGVALTAVEYVGGSGRDLMLGVALAGSGTNKQDKVDCEDQFQRKKRSLSWLPSPFTALTVRATRWCAMVMPPMANSSIAAVPADSKAVRIRLPTPIPKHAARRSSMQAQERSSLRGLTRTFGVSRTTVSSWIKKK
jgi:hypothetical protein